ncbi:glycoside hydrolase family 30 protein [Flavobacterium kingsejongi]|uniref:Glycosyl hydrolase n=1 Tax=Flavobacterium kingsejongi TaxID=1678728 RepID=A0A2S1LRB5_9FLAO|nr:glycoside hydrolase family 30 protein [Flavobacterium kingsejongi]AWG26295.1 glycosyl hydrolase [Flavobacterium kingsejongi]
MKNRCLIFAMLVSALVSAQKQPSASVEGKKITVYTTAENTDYRISPTATANFKKMGQPLETQICVFVDPTHSFQSIMGFGGAITDAAAETFAKMPKAQQQEILTAYFDAEKGIGYTIGRTTIHSSDFSSGSYTYIKEGDASLKSFNIDHDKKFRIPMIKQAMKTAGGKLTLYGSPWSPPAFMKDNNNMLKGGKLKPEFYQSWANYYTKFIAAYEKEGIPIWGISIQNEPMATQIWESCIYTAEEERDFLKNYLGPTMHKAGYADKKIIAWDHNRDLIYQRASTMLNDPEAAKYVWGIGYHWYENWSGGEQMFGNLAKVHEAFPETNLIFTEGCKEAFKLDKINDWKLGELYGNAMINDLNSGITAWTDWNILLDQKGGPNHVGNFCFAPIHGDTESGKVMYTNEYYYIGHFSKFIRPGAKRIASTPSRSAISSTAFLNKDGKTAVVVMNKGDEKVSYFLWIDGQAAELSIAPHAIQTLVY